MKNSNLQTTDTSPQKSTLIKIIIFLISGMVIVGSIVGAFIYIGISKATNPARDVANEFIFDLADAKYNDAYLLSSDAFKENIQISDLQNFTENYSVLDNASNVTWNIKNIKDSVVELSGTLSSADDETVITMEIMQYDGLWLVNFISFNPNDVPQDNTSSDLSNDTLDN